MILKFPSHLKEPIHESHDYAPNFLGMEMRGTSLIKSRALIETVKAIFGERELAEIVKIDESAICKNFSPSSKG